MSRIILASITLAFACNAQAADTAPARTLSAFANDAQLQAFFKDLASKQQAKLKRERAENSVQKMSPMAPSAVAPPAPAPSVAGFAADAAAQVAESVTNTQTAGVDEGGIVKVHGKHLVMLRRGRLFTVDIGRGQLQPISSINAYAPEADPSGTWYDEMLISGNTVAVIGFSYSRGGTEIGLFDIDANGRLSYRSTYHMRSNDYYSSRNYASRQIGSKLVFYTPLYLNPWQADPFASFPALRKWRPNAAPSDFQRIAPATRIYRSDDEIEPGAGLALHTVTVCDLAQRDMQCEATAVLGPSGRVFYVSGESVYVWTTSGGRRRRGPAGQSGLFRIPLDGSAPSILKVEGAPIDQFSFLESADGHLNVLVRSEGRGEAMWNAERGSGSLALLRVPLRRFSDGRASAPADSYQALPAAGGYSLQNRYIGPWLLYGNADQGRSALQALRWDGQGQVQSLTLPHGVERIEAMGSDAVIVGANGPDLHFSSIALGRQAALAHRFVQADAAEGETRSHGFFYKPDGNNSGIVGLPVLQQGGRQGNTASVLYLRNRDRELDQLGTLRSRPTNENDGCRASCVDWYGNARPLFLQGRVFALMGYELVEGKVDGGRLSEVQRINYSPRR